MSADKKNYFKLFFALIACLLVRLMPLRAPNVEPILAAMMPMSKVYGAFLGFAFAVSSILLYDVISGTLGVHTFFTTLAYGALGLWAANYFRNKKSDRWTYVRFAIIGTLFYDALTGLTVGPLFFYQPFLGSLTGQIPFTALHLAGNASFAFFLSPIIYNYLIKNKKPEPAPIINSLNPKTI